MRTLFGIGVFFLGLVVAAVNPALAAAKAQETTPLTVVVGDPAAGPVGAVHVNRMVDIPWASLTPGSTVLVAPGTYTGEVVVTGKGAPGNYIRVQALDPAQKPIIAGGDCFNFVGASYVSISGFVVDGPTYAGVIIRDTSDHIRVTDSEIKNSKSIGIEIHGGTGHRIARNLIHDSFDHGIAVGFGANAEPNDRTRISYNTIFNNGTHGIELSGSHYDITHNTVHDNGLRVGGSTGIHLYNDEARKDQIVCNENKISYNFSFNNHDAVHDKTDGNGIQIDHWCDNNEVSFNVTYGNDGAGINIYDGANNKVFKNTLFDNARDHRAGFRGDLVISTQSLGIDRANNNEIRDNVIITTQSRSGTDARVDPPVAPVVIAWESRDNGNIVASNILFNRVAGKPAIYMGGQVGFTTDDVNRLTGQTQNVVANPAFINELDPLHNGLDMVRALGPVGTKGGRTDMAGDRLDKTEATVGAYFTPVE